jgi:hypothetical protein
VLDLLKATKVDQLEFNCQKQHITFKNKPILYLICDQVINQTDHFILVKYFKMLADILNLIPCQGNQQQFESNLYDDKYL